MKLLLEKMVRQTEGSAEAQRKLQADLRNKKLAHEIDKWVGVDSKKSITCADFARVSAIGPRKMKTTAESK